MKSILFTIQEPGGEPNARKRLTVHVSLNLSMMVCCSVSVPFVDSRGYQELSSQESADLFIYLGQAQDLTHLEDRINKLLLIDGSFRIFFRG